MKEYSLQDAENICESVFELMNDSALSFNAACRASNIAPSIVMRWIAADSRVEERYRHARYNLVERLAAETIELLEEPPRLTEDGRVDSAWVQYQKERTSARRWMISKLAPQVYGDRLLIPSDDKKTNPIAELLNEVQGTSFQLSKQPIIIDEAK